MTDIRAIELIASMCGRMLGLLILVAESVIPLDARPARKYVKLQRQWLNEQQDMLELEKMVNEAMGDAE